MVVACRRREDYAGCKAGTARRRFVTPYKGEAFGWSGRKLLLVVVLRGLLGFF